MALSKVMAAATWPLFAMAALSAPGCGAAWDEDPAPLEDAELVAADDVETYAAALTTDVVPIDWSRFSAPPTDADAQRLRSILLNTNRYSLTHWYGARGYDRQTDTYLVLGDGLPWQDSSPTGEHRVRSAGSVAMALAVSLQLGIYDPAVVTVDRALAKARALKLIRSLAFRHRINSSGGWGRGWQSPLWALYAGTAGWLMWADLSPTDRTHVRRMVEDEARRLVGYRVPYYRDHRDVVVSDGDSKAEENAWNAQFLFLAVNMMPGHPMRAAWEAKAAELAVSAHARVVDRTSNTALVSGRPVRDWLRGSNVEPDGSVVNHDIIHPDYMATAAYTASAPIWYGLRGAATPDAMFAGAPVVYDALVDRFWPSGPYRAPGGTMYIEGSGDIYFPQGTDWGALRRINYAFFDVVARHFEVDTLASERAPVWERLHAKAALDLQARSTNGRTYVDDGEDAYKSREEWVAAHAALSYLTTWIGAQRAYVRTASFLPVVIDNQDLEFNVTGSWANDAPAGRLGDSNRYHEGGGPGGSRRAQWKPAVPLPAGRYRVYAWWSAFHNHAHDVPYTIYRTGGRDVVQVDQRGSGDRWNYLTTIDVDGTASTGYVELWNQTSSGYVVADGVMFQRI